MCAGAEGASDIFRNDTNATNSSLNLENQTDKFCRGGGFIFN